MIKLTLAFKTSLFTAFCFLSLISLCFVQPASAVSLSPDLIEKMRADGTLDQYVKQMAEARAKGVWTNADKSTRYRLTSDGAPDTMRIVMILVDFDDNRWQTGPDGTLEYFQNLIFSDSVLQYGSMKEYYFENSYGKFVLTGQVYGWYRMPETYAYYVDGQAGFGTYPRNAQKLIEDAVAVADPYIDYSLYDNDGDGMVEGLMVVHAGEGRETSGSMNQIHSHMWFMNSVQHYDGVDLYRYSIQPEETSTGDKLIDIGVFCHEFGHVLGLPDLYDTDYSSSGLGNWTLMAGGSYNGGAMIPAHFDAWCKSQLGFINVDTITANELGHSIPRVEETPYAARIWRNGTSGLQYFLVENRQKVKFDAGLPGDGLLIYHVDENQSGNTDENHYLVAIEQADGLFQLEQGSGRGNQGDPWPGSTDAREFNDITVPNTHDYTDATTQVAVWDISDSDSLMTANLDVTFSKPYFKFIDYRFSDSAGGDGDGIFELGESINCYFTISNLWAEATDVTLLLEAADPRLVFTTDSVYLGTVTTGQTVDNSGNPFTFEIPPDMDTLKTDFLLTITQTTFPDTVTFGFRENIGGVAVLVIDDDDGDPDSLESYYTNTLENLGMTFSVWDKSSKGSPTPDKASAPIIIWFTGDSRPTTLTAADRAFIRDYLDNGGNLFLTGQDIAEHMSVDDPELLHNYFKCQYDGSHWFKDQVIGQDGSYIGRDSIRVMIVNPDGAHNQSSVDYFSPLEGGIPCFSYNIGDAGLEIDADNYRAVLFGFGFEAVNNTYTAFGFETREFVMDRVINFFRLPEQYTCGDVTGDEMIDVDDIVFLIAYLFLEGPAPDPIESGDVNCDNNVNLLDVVYIVNYQFRGGQAPCTDCP